MRSAPPVLVPVGRFVWGRPQAVLLALVVAALSALLAWVAGSLSLAGVLRQPVVQTLRQASD